MLKTPIAGELIRADVHGFAVRDGAAVDTYSWRYYRLAQEPERRTRLLAYRAAVMRRVEAAGWRWRPVVEI